MTYQKEKIWIFVDNEGPCTLNDNAQENTVALAKKCGFSEEVGISFYKNTSNIDDIWGDFHKIPKDPSYSSGHTLKVVLPFYKALGANSQWLYEFARKSIRIVPNIVEVLANLSRKYNTWMISTSYEFFIRAFCDRVGFDFPKARCTPVPKFDEIPINDEEILLLLTFMKEIVQMPTIEYDPKTGQVIPEHQASYEHFTNFIWETIYNLPVGALLRIVHPVGQAQKRETVEEILKESRIPLEKVMGVGDSQTDLQWVRLLTSKGLSIMFNGKDKVCHESDIMYIGEDARAIEEVADLFAKWGRQGVINYYKPPREAKCGGLLAAVTPENIEELELISAKKRKEFRGIHIGELT
jgi:predicted HAD superfamily phosphohydrolase